MICPIELTHEVSDLSGRVQRCMTGCSHAANNTGRSGAGDETTGRNVAGNGEADHLVSGSGDPGDQLPPDAVGTPGSSMKDTRDCLIGGAECPRRNGCRWRRWRQCCGCTRSSTLTSTCGTSTRSLCRRGKRPNPSLPTAAWESQAKKPPDFPTFPELLLDIYMKLTKTKPDTSLANKTGHFNLLTTPIA